MRGLPAAIGLMMVLMQTDGLRTRAERTNFEETTRYEEVTQYIAKLQQQTGFLRVESFGRSEQGRDLPLMIFANPPISTSREAAATGIPVIFVMANIHAGNAIDE